MLRHGKFSENPTSQGFVLPDSKITHLHSQIYLFFNYENAKIFDYNAFSLCWNTVPANINLFKKKI